MRTIIHCRLCYDSGERQGLAGPFGPKALDGFCSCILGKRLLWCKLNNKPLNLESEIESLPFTYDQVITWRRPQTEEEFLKALKEGRLYVGSPDTLWNRAKSDKDSRFLGTVIFQTVGRVEPGREIEEYKDIVRIKPEE